MPAEAARNIEQTPLPETPPPAAETGLRRPPSSVPRTSAGARGSGMAFGRLPDEEGEEKGAEVKIELAEPADLKTARHLARAAKAPRDTEAVVIDLSKKREAWISRLNTLKEKKVQLPADKQEMELLERRLKKADLIQERIKFFQARDAAWEETEETEKRVEENRAALKRAQEEQWTALEGSEKTVKAIESQHARLKELEEERDRNAGQLSSDAAQQLAELPGIIQSLETEEAGHKSHLTELESRIQELNGKISQDGNARDAARQRYAESATEIARITLALSALKGVVVETQETKEMKTEESKKTEKIETAETKKGEKNSAGEKKKPSRGVLPAFGRGTYMATWSVLAAAFGAAAAAGRLVETFFGRLYDLFRNPKKLFSDIAARFKRDGFFGGIKWLFLGEPLSSLRAKKERSTNIES